MHTRSSVRARNMRRAQQQALVLAAFSLAASLVGAHQHCHFGARNPAVGFNSEIGFCSNDDPEGFCCDAREENDVKSRYDLHSLRGDCASLHKEVSRLIHSAASPSRRSYLNGGQVSVGLRGICPRFVCECAGCLLVRSYLIDLLCPVHADCLRWWSYSLRSVSVGSVVSPKVNHTR